MAYNLADILGKPAQALLKRGISQSTTATALCERLDGRCIAVRTGSANLDVHFLISNGQLSLQPGVAANADAVITGSPLQLARLVSGDPEAVIREGHVQILGDTEVATDFRALLEFARPDLEEELASVTGDVFAHEAGRAVRGVAGWAAGARRSLGRSLGEYLVEERRDLIAVTELEEFCRDVDVVAADVDRLAAKLALLRTKRSA